VLLIGKKKIYKNTSFYKKYFFPLLDCASRLCLDASQLPLQLTSIVIKILLIGKIKIYKNTSYRKNKNL
jgi:hypothetical protein